MSGFYKFHILVHIFLIWYFFSLSLSKYMCGSACLWRKVLSMPHNGSFLCLSLCVCTRVCVCVRVCAWRKVFSVTRRKFSNMSIHSNMFEIKQYQSNYRILSFLGKNQTNWTYISHSSRQVNVDSLLSFLMMLLLVLINSVFL